jgi:hypothetical protein
MQHISQEISYLPGRKAAQRRISSFDVARHQKDGTTLQELARLGIGWTTRSLRSMQQELASMGYAMDALNPLQPTITSGTIPVPIQFLQEWLPGFVLVMTAARKIDDLIGISMMGSWEDEQVVQPLLEITGGAQPYGDYTNLNLSNWNIEYNTATVVRFEQGMMVSVLEEARSSRINVDPSVWKREAVLQALEIQRNNIGFVGYNAGANNTYGFLNAPGLPNYVTVPAGASTSTLWANKTFVEIQNDILGMVTQIIVNSKDQLNPYSSDVDFTLAIATASIPYLGRTAEYGQVSVRKWINDTFPRMRIESAPELTAANSNANVAYLYADAVRDASTDGGRVWLQCVQAKAMSLGVKQEVKGYVEATTNATAGVIAKRPWAITRVTGI